MSRAEPGLKAYNRQKNALQRHTLPSHGVARNVHTAGGTPTLRRQPSALSSQPPSQRSSATTSKVLGLVQFTGRSWVNWPLLLKPCGSFISVKAYGLWDFMNACHACFTYSTSRQPILELGGSFKLGCIEGPPFGAQVGVIRTQTLH